MLAGASGIDLVLLVIATDELIKPQTREHFDICRLLGVQRGVIALTKSDLADSDTRELARMEIEEFVKGTFLAGAPIVEVSAKTRQGLPELKAALREAARAISAKDTGRYFRLPIDRSFAVKGFGSVVTGTLFSGHVAVGEEVELLPSGKILRVRGLQTGGKSVERAEAGQRTAVNLAGIEHTAIQRGMVKLSSCGRLRTTRRADVRLGTSARRASCSNTGAQVHFHAGTLGNNWRSVLAGRARIGAGRKRTGTAPVAGRRGSRARRPIHRAAIFPGSDDWRRRCARSHWHGDFTAKRHGPRPISSNTGKRFARRRPAGDGGKKHPRNHGRRNHCPHRLDRRPRDDTARRKRLRTRSSYASFRMSR